MQLQRDGAIFEEGQCIYAIHQTLNAAVNSKFPIRVLNLCPENMVYRLHFRALKMHDSLPPTVGPWPLGPLATLTNLSLHIRSVNELWNDGHRMRFHWLFSNNTCT